VIALDAYLRGFHAGANLQQERRRATNVDPTYRTHYMRGFPSGRRAAKDAQRDYWARLRETEPATAEASR
jgi:hypothetical protein